MRLLRFDRHRGVSRLVGTAVVVAITLWAGYVLARPDGMTGVAQSATGCSCHSSTPNANGAVTVSVMGPIAVQPGSTHTYTIWVTGGPAGTVGGFNLKADAGTLIAGPNNKVVGGELTHSNPDQRSWNFDWTAPSTNTTAHFYAVAQACNGNGNNQGDSWNWYGAAVNTPFNITVDSSVGVGDGGPAAFWLAPTRPNPFVGRAHIGFSLPQAGPARVEIFDLGGRRIALLASGEMSAGPHEVVWDGRNGRSQPVSAGSYLIRLESGGRVLTTRVVRVSG